VDVARRVEILWQGPDDGAPVKRELQMIIALRHNDPRHSFNNPFRALDCAPSPKCQKGMPSLDLQQRTQAFRLGISDANRGQQ
jgi:hypothetical protein